MHMSHTSMTTIMDDVTREGRSSNQCDNFCVRRTTLYTALKPFLVSMKVAGLYHFKQFKVCDSDKAEENDDTTQRKKYVGIKLTPSMVYTATLCTVLCMNVLRVLSAFEKHADTFDLPGFLFDIVLLSWNINCAINAVACFLACHKFEGLTKMFLENDKLQGICTDERHLVTCRRRAIAYTIGSWVLVWLNIFVGIYMTFATSLLDSSIAPADANDHFVVIYKSLYVVLHSFLSCSWFFPMILFYIICKILCDRFDKFNGDLKRAIRANDNNLPTGFSAYRQRHMSLCKLVSYADEFLSIISGSSLGISALQITINVYSLIWNEHLHNDVTSLMVVLFWTAGACCSIAIICIGAALVNGKAHASLDLVHSAKFSHDYTREEEFQVQLFVAKLNGPQIGLTALKMFVVDKPTILTLLSLLMTYFVIIVQFSPSFTGGTTPCHCNCTAL